MKLFFFCDIYILGKLKIELIKHIFKTNIFNTTGVFFSQSCEVGSLVVIHKRTYPNLTMGQRGKWKDE
jgi:hypothetical protein